MKFGSPRGALRGLFFSQGVQLQERIGIAGRGIAVRLATSTDEGVKETLAVAQSCLVLATEAAQTGNIDTGWAYLHRAREIEVFTFAEAELRTTAVELRLEAAGGKLRDWRQAAVLEMIDMLTRERPEAAGFDERRHWLATATKVRNDSLSGEYRALSLLRQQQAVLLALGALVLVPTMMILASHSGEFDKPNGLDQSWVIITSALMGAAGAITSGLQRSTKRKWQRVSEQIWSFVSSLSRPIIGLVAGLTVYLAARTGIATPERHAIAIVLLAAFAGGFSERVVLRALSDEQAGQPQERPAPQDAGPLIDG